MNHALKQDLRTLSKLPGDPGMPAFRALFRMRAGDQARFVEKWLRAMIILMPDFLERVRRQSTGTDKPASVRRLYGHLLTYLYEPRDIIPEDGNGFFGYLDDAYLVASAYERTLPEDADRSIIRRWLDTARWVIPAETAQLDRILDELIAGHATSYVEAMGPTRGS